MWCLLRTMRSLAGIIADQDVTVSHAGGSNAGALDAGVNANFSVDEETGAVTTSVAAGL